MSGGAFSTTIGFDNDQDVDIEQSSVSATVGYQLSTRWGVVGSLGGILGGTVTTDVEGDIGTGITGSISGTYLAMYEGEKKPFILGSLTFGSSRTSVVSDDTMEHTWQAFDLRAGCMVGKTFAERFVPFASARVFGGPVLWTLGGEDVIGSDIYKYTLGAGFTYRIPGTFSIFVEALPVGEQSASLGASMTF